MAGEGRRFTDQRGGTNMGALVYDGSFPLDFLWVGERVGAVQEPPGACQITRRDGESMIVGKGELLVRDIEGRLYVFEPTDYDEGDDG